MAAISALSSLPKSLFWLLSAAGGAGVAIWSCRPASADCWLCRSAASWLSSAVSRSARSELLSSELLGPELLGPELLGSKFVIFADSIVSLLLAGIRAAISAVFWRCCQMAKLARPIAKTDKAKAANVIKEPALDEGPLERPLGGGAVWLFFDALACGGAV